MSFLKKYALSTRKAILLSGYLFFGIALSGFSQQILWEKYWPNVKGRFDAMVQGDSGFYYGCGPMKVVRNFNQPAQLRDTLEGIILVKLTADGDTVWFKKICDDVSGGASSGAVFMQKGSNGLLHLSLTWAVWSVYEHRVFSVLQSNGLSLLTVQIPILTATTLKGMTIDKDENLYLYGEREKAINSNTYEMYCIKVKANGELAYERSYSPNNHPSSAAQYAEPMPEGKLRVSGNKGKTIVVYELDSAGNETNYRELVDNPFGYVQQVGAYVQQAERGYFLVSNRSWDGTSGSTTQSYVSKVDSNNNVVWSETKVGSITQPSVNTAGGYLIVGGQTGAIYFQSFNIQNELLWAVNTTTPNVPGSKGTGKLLFLNDNSGIHYGRNVLNGSFYPFAMKIGNVGYPVDPSNPVPPVLSVNEEVSQSKNSYAFPNPTTGIFHVAGMGSGHFRMVDSQGRTVMEAEHKGGDAIDVSELPCGVYTYSLITKGSKTQGRIVRE